MIHTVPNGGGGGAGRNLPGKALGGNNLAGEPLGRLQVHTARSGGKVDNYAVLPCLPQPRSIQNEGGRCVEDQIKAFQLSGERPGLYAAPFIIS